MPPRAPDRRRRLTGEPRGAGALHRRLSGRAEDVALEPLVAERSARVEALDQTDEIEQPLVAGRGQEHLAPVRARAERREGGFEILEDALDRALVRLPREVDGDAVL